MITQNNTQIELDTAKLVVSHEKIVVYSFIL